MKLKVMEPEIKKIQEVISIAQGKKWQTECELGLRLLEKMRKKV
jgi:hypothetical protein